MKEQYEIRWVDYYALLQVLPTAETEVIEGAYKQLMVKYHPDRNAAPDAIDKVKLLNEAKEILRDPARRAAYDKAHTAHVETARPLPRKKLAQVRKRLREEPSEEEWRSNLHKPHILVRPGEVDLGECSQGETRVADLQVRVSGGRAVIGDVAADQPWIQLSSRELFGKYEKLQVIVDTSELAPNCKHTGTLTISTVLHGSRVVPVTIQVKPGVTGWRPQRKNGHAPAPRTELKREDG